MNDGHAAVKLQQCDYIKVSITSLFKVLSSTDQLEPWPETCWRTTVEMVWRHFVGVDKSIYTVITSRRRKRYPLMSLLIRESSPRLKPCIMWYHPPSNLRAVLNWLREHNQVTADISRTDGPLGADREWWEPVEGGWVARRLWPWLLWWSV